MFAQRLASHAGQRYSWHETEHLLDVQEHSLPYLLLADKNDRLRKGFEVKNNLLVLPGRQVSS